MLSPTADPIVAIATAPGRGAVGIVRVSGRALAPLARALTGRALAPHVATSGPSREADGRPIDHGPGIPEAVAAQLFRPFFTTSGHGTGLGLYIARELCLANQASLDHVPIPGGGCCFRIRLASAHAITTG